MFGDVCERRAVLRTVHSQLIGTPYRWNSRAVRTNWVRGLKGLMRRNPPPKTCLQPDTNKKQIAVNALLTFCTMSIYPFRSQVWLARTGDGFRMNWICSSTDKVAGIRFQTVSLHTSAFIAPFALVHISTTAVITYCTLSESKQSVFFGSSVVVPGKVVGKVVWKPWALVHGR